MAITNSDFYKTQAEILETMFDQLVAAIPDAYTGEDGAIGILFTIEAGQFEVVFLSNQLLLEDMFPQTASQTALRLHGEQYGEAFKDGTKATGVLKFTGQSGLYIPLGTEVAYDPGTGVDPVYFVTTEDGTIPNPGTPTPPTAAINATAGNLTGTYVWRVTFYTADGETASSVDSNSISPSAQQANLTAIPLGGPGTIGRRIYRQKNGTGDYRLVTDIANNTATTFTDNVTDATVNANALMPSQDSSNVILLDAEAEETGLDGNANPGTIRDLTNAPTGLTDVTNPQAFTAGSDPEDTEDFRARLLGRIRSPQTGSPSDLKVWAEEVEGVETATVFENMNITTPANGHTTVRIAGPNGTIPGASVIQEVLDTLESKDIANITLHVTTFTQVSTNVTVTLTLASGFTHTDVDSGVSQAIKDYINQLEVGETLYPNGIVDAVFGLPGVVDLTVTTPATPQTTAADSKRIPGTITIS
jgi:uncharacterized phage protein gp47/JayE